MIYWYKVLSFYSLCSAMHLFLMVASLCYHSSSSQAIQQYLLSPLISCMCQDIPDLFLNCLHLPLAKVNHVWKQTDLLMMNTHQLFLKLLLSTALAQVVHHIVRGNLLPILKKKGVWILKSLHISITIKSIILFKRSARNSPKTAQHGNLSILLLIMCVA